MLGMYCGICLSLSVNARDAILFLTDPQVGPFRDPCKHIVNNNNNNPGSIRRT